MKTPSRWITGNTIEGYKMRNNIGKLGQALLATFSPNTPTRQCSVELNDDSCMAPGMYGNCASRSVQLAHGTYATKHHWGQELNGSGPFIGIASISTVTIVSLKRKTQEFWRRLKSLKLQSMKPISKYLGLPMSSLSYNNSFMNFLNRGERANREQNRKALGLM